MFSRKYRPNDFSEFRGNEEAVSYFLNTPTSEWASTYLVSGPSGIGKTTLARVVANKLADPISIKEIDSAQDRGIDKIRAIIRESWHRPIKGKNKVLIFDEFHQVTKDAQEALLKITEEPPAHLYFFLCSTDPQKIRPTIRNRCNLIDLKSVSNKELGLILRDIAVKEEIEWTEARKQIGKLIIDESDGIPRKAVMLFDKLYNYSSVEEAKAALGIIYETDDTIYPLFVSILKGDLNGMIDNLPDKNYESVRIAIARMLCNRFKKERNAKYIELLGFFNESIDNRLGDMNLIESFYKLSIRNKI